MIELAKKTDLVSINILAKQTRKHMLDIGLKQWIDDYPNYTYFLSDFEQKGLFVFREEKQIVASISILPDRETAYKEIEWFKRNSLVIHRVMVNPSYQKLGIGIKLLTFAISYARDNEYDSIKVDTHPDNYRMQGLIKKVGFKKVGYLSGINRLAYELVL